MVNKLLIELDIDYEKRLQDIVDKRTLVRGTDLTIDYKITNIGDEDFAGGILEEVSADFLQSLHAFRYPKTTLPKIAKNETKTVYRWDLILAESGLVWMQCKITPNDGKPIQFFQIPEIQGGVSVELPNTWKNYYTVLDREPLETILLLKSIDEKLNKLLSKIK